MTVSRIAGKDITDDQARDLAGLFRQPTAAERQYDAASGLRLYDRVGFRPASSLMVLDNGG